MAGCCGQGSPGKIALLTTVAGGVMGGMFMIAPPWQQRGPARSPGAVSPAAGLERRVTLEARDQPLAEVLKDLSRQSSLDFEVVGGIDTIRVTATLVDIAAGDALSSLLANRQMTYAVAGNGRTILISRGP